MTAIEIIVIVCAVAVLAGVVIAAVLRKKKGKTSCGCDCAHCPGCASHKKTNEDKPNK